MLKFVLTITILFVIIPNAAFAEQILTTLRHDAENTIFDGKWSFLQEWKSTSEDIIVFPDGKKVSIRTGHDYENLYILLDFISDTSIQKNSDRGIVCIDSKLDRGGLPAEDDYCFMIVVDSSNPITLQGGHFLSQTGHWKKIENHPKFIAAGGVSDKNDRYSPTPHATYEFKIPIEIFERSDKYGFYIQVYDAKFGMTYNWPPEAYTDRYPFISSPAKWGLLISPDKSIPEFDLPLLVFLPLIVFVVIFNRLRHGFLKTT